MQYYIGITRLSCCGVKEIHDITGSHTPAVMLKDVCDSRYREGTYSAYYIFTDNKWPATHGRALRQYIEDNNLGTVHVIDPKATNPNTHNKITMYIWQVNDAALYEWGKTIGKLTYHNTYMLEFIGENNDGWGDLKSKPTIKKKVKDFVKAAFAQ